MSGGMQLVPCAAAVLRPLLVLDPMCWRDPINGLRLTYPCGVRLMTLPDAAMIFNFQSGLRPRPIHWLLAPGNIDIPCSAEAVQDGSLVQSFL